MNLFLPLINLFQVRAMTAALMDGGASLYINQSGETEEGETGEGDVVESALCAVVRAGNLGVAAMVLQRDPCVSRHHCRRGGQGQGGEGGQGQGGGGGEGGRDMMLTVEVRQ